MTSSTEITPEIKRIGLGARIGWTVLILATLYACYFRHLGAIGFVGPDEPRYAWIARAMAESGDWVTPRLYGKPWFEKPPLYYWGAAISFKILGVNEAAARLPSALSALIATLALAWLAWRTFGAEIARWLLVLLPTTVAMVGFSHAAAPDMPFAGMLTIALVCACVLMGLMPAQHSAVFAEFGTPLQRETSLPQRTWVLSVLFGVFLGLAVLAKGPAAIILCGGSVLFWALVTKRWRDALRTLHPAGIAALCAVTLPWYVLCAERNPDFFRIFIIEHNFKRYLTPEFQHVQPFWYYVPILLMALLPWTLLLFPTINEARKSFYQQMEHSGLAIFLSCWVLVVWAFFSFSKSKLPGYILPAIPALVLLISVPTARLLRTSSRFIRALFAVTTAIALAMIAAGIDYPFRLRSASVLQQARHVWPVPLALVAIALFLALAGAVFVISRRARIGAIATVVAIVAFLCVAPVSRIDDWVSARPTAAALAKARRPGEQVWLCDVGRSYAYAFSFYLHEEVPDYHPNANARDHALVIIGSPACWSELAGANYYETPGTESTRWPVIELEPESAPGSADGRQMQ